MLEKKDAIKQIEILSAKLAMFKSIFWQILVDVKSTKKTNLTFGRILI